MLIAGLAVMAVSAASPAAFGKPLYPNSVVSNDHEFIATSDDSAFACLVFEGRHKAEMPDKRSDQLRAEDNFIYTAHYTDGTSVGIWAHPNFKTEERALKSVTPAAEAVGKLPTFMRRVLDHVVIHRGNATAFSDHLGHFFVLYSANIKVRIRNHDLEETVFHEAVHATLDYKYARSAAWRELQKADGDFITKYAKRKPTREDLAESALFAWAMTMHPGRLPARVEARVREIMPNRLAFLEELFRAQPLFENIGQKPAC